MGARFEGTRMTSRRLTPEDAEATAKLHRASFDDRLPWLPGLHTSDEDRAFYTHVVFDQCEVWGTFEDGALIAFIAFREHWIDQFYVLPEHQGRGIGKCPPCLGASPLPQAPIVDVPEERSCAALL